jgi:NAD(P)-dependent dehydrogenase (short-subunit alcohol dehydrogenase family)
MGERLDRVVDRIAERAALYLSGWHDHVSPGRQAKGETRDGAVGVRAIDSAPFARVFRGKSAIVTGAASGIGRSLAIQLAASGASVVLADVNEEGARAVAESIVGAGHRARHAPLDVTDFAAVERLVADVAREHGRLDYMFNNAGILIGGPVESMTAEHWRRIVDVNLLGVIHGVRAAYPRMVSQGTGHIVNTASLAGIAPSPWIAAYSMTKHAVLGLSASLWGEAFDKGVCVSAACPGFIDTGIFRAATYLSSGPRSLFDVIGIKPTPADACARAILRGVARKKPIILVTPETRLTAFAQRLSPTLLLVVGRWRARRLLSEPA